MTDLRVVIPENDLPYAQAALASHLSALAQKFADDATSRESVSVGALLADAEEIAGCARILTAVCDALGDGVVSLS